MNTKTDHWQQHVGSVWASLLLNHSLDCSGTIIEIGPGFTDKIGRGLAKLQFHGKLYIIEPNKAALEWVVKWYQTLLPNATIIPVNKAVQHACAMLPTAVEAILMNHVLDDMVLHAGLPAAEQQIVFSQTKPGAVCLSEVKTTWQDLLGNPSHLLKLKQKVFTHLFNLIDGIGARIVGMSQYTSWFLRENELSQADLLGNKLLGEMVSHLGDMSMEDKNILRSHNQNPQDWLIVERESTLGLLDNKPNSKQQTTKIKV